MTRLTEYARLLRVFGAWGLLFAFWGLWIAIFLHFMLPRFGYLLGALPIGNDQPCGRPECDFSVFWLAGFLAHAHDYLALYSGTDFISAATQALPPNSYLETFFYPPPILLPAALIAHFPFETAFFVWTALGIAIAVAALRWARISWLVIALTLLSPAALWNTMLGQLGVVGGALLAAGLLRAQDRPFTAGGLLGLLACKRQTGILIPAALLGLRRWRGMAGFAGVCMLLVLLTLVLFGWPVWQSYLAHGRQGGASLLTASFAPRTAQASGVSIFWMMRSLHAGVGLAGAVQMAVTALVMGFTVWLWARGRMPMLDKAALTTLLSLLATPYGYTDDMVAASALVAALAERRGWRIGLREVAFWLWPVFCPTVSVLTGILVTPLVVVLAAWHVWGGAALRARATVLPPRPTGA
jgi:alpha-1,2-mannosyltransferase